MNSVYDEVIGNQPIRGVLQEVISTIYYSSFFIPL